MLDLTSIPIGNHIGKMFTSVSQFEPLFPSKSGELEDLARNLVAVSAKLEGRLSPVVLADIRELLRVVNSYYSNLIEGNGTHPIDIERAMAGDYSSNEQKRDLQIESRIHIEVQRKISFFDKKAVFALVSAIHPTGDVVKSLTTQTVFVGKRTRRSFFVFRHCLKHQHARTG